MDIPYLALAVVPAPVLAILRWWFRDTRAEPVLWTLLVLASLVAAVAILLLIFLAIFVLPYTDH